MEAFKTNEEIAIDNWYIRNTVKESCKKSNKIPGTKKL